MKTAVSVPNDVYERVERLAMAAGRSRSEVYSAALREYVARHSPDEVTGTLNRVIADLGEDATLDQFGKGNARWVLESSDW